GFYHHVFLAAQVQQRKRVEPIRESSRGTVPPPYRKVVDGSVNQIPSELRALPQWLVSGQNKIPISPKTKRAADVRNPELFTTFERAHHDAQAHALDIAGLLTPDDPYTVIDVDSSAATVEQQERHRNIYDSFDTYAELSRSRGGVHMWCRGSVPSGSRRD